VINGLDQVPQTLLSNAGIGERYKATLSPVPMPTTVAAYFEYSLF